MELLVCEYSECISVSVAHHRFMFTSSLLGSDSNQNGAADGHSGFVLILKEFHIN